VVAVALYHFGLHGFSGGFVGVDIYFVISGLLMTGIVVSNLERGKLSVWGFYLARGRRILPALLALCAVLMILGWFYLLPIDYKTLGSQEASAAVFLSNMKFWLEAGYFDSSSHEKWFLHSWSLAVEWQFYMLLPLFFLGVWKLRPGRGPIAWFATLGLVLSFGLCVALTPINPSGSFFLLPTRAWEMLSGGLLYLLAHHVVLSNRQRQVIEAMGLAVIVACIGGFDSQSAWPGWRAAFPVAATVAVLLAARPQSVWTANPIAQWLGTRSYSIYLWHWPIVVALNYGNWQQKSWAVVAGLVLTTLLGHVSYRWVEVPARALLSKQSTVRAIVTLTMTAALVALAGLLVRLNQGVPGRFSKEIDMVKQEALNWNQRREACHPGSGFSSPLCKYGGERTAVFVLGDSHANAVISAVVDALPTAESGAIELSYSGCPTIEGVQYVQAKYANMLCKDFINWTLRQLDKVEPNVPLVIVNRHAQYALGPNEKPEQENKPMVYFSKLYSVAEPAFLNEYSQHLTDTACKLAKSHAVYLVRPIPEMGINVPNTARAMVWGQQPNVSLSLANYHQRNDFIWAAQDVARDQCGIKILDPLPYLCWDGVCHGLKDGRPLYHDDNHLSEFGNKLLVPMFDKMFK
jgi:peptidoglycan/LPS O-acetylase OafA/YrhL